MSLIAVTSSQGLSVLSSAALRAAHPDPTPTLTTLLTPPSRIPSQCISWSPDASAVFVASGGSVSAYDPSSGACLQEVVREGEGGIGGAKLGSMVVLQTQPGTGAVLAFARGARAVVFDSETRRAVHTVEGHRSSIFAMSLAHDQTLLATSSAETTMITNLVQQTNTVLRGAPPGVVAAAFHPTQRTTLLILSPRGLYVFDVTKGGAPTRTIPIGKAEGGSGSIAFSPCTPSLVAIVVPGGGGRVLMLDIEKESSLVKKFTVEETVTAMSFSHDGGAVIVGTEGGRILQLNLRSIDKPAQAVVVDPAGGRIGGLALAVGSVLKATRSTSSAAVKPSVSTAPVAGTRQTTRPARAESVTSTSTGGSVRVRSSTANLRATTTNLRPKPAADSDVKSPETLRTADSKSPGTLRTKLSSMDLLGKTSAVAKTSPGTLRVKAGVENKPRPSSMITGGAGKERTGTRVRPVSMIEEKAGDTIGRAGKPLSVGDLKREGEVPSPGVKAPAASEAADSPLRTTTSPTLRRQTQTMPRRLTTDGARRPTLSQVFAQDDLVASPARSRSSSQSATPISAVAPLSARPSQTSPSNQNSSTPVGMRPALVSTTPSYTPGPGSALGGQAETTTPDYPPEERFAGTRGAVENERDRPWSRLGEDRERTRSRLGEERVRSRLGNDGAEERPRDTAEPNRDRPASRLFRDETDRPSSRVSNVLGLGRPSGMLARKFSTEFAVTPETMRAVSDLGVVRERAGSVGGDSRERERSDNVLRERPENVLRERPESVLRERPESIFRERVDSVLRDRSRSGTPLSVSGRGKRVGWVDEESPYVDGLHDGVRTPARTPPPPLSSASGSSDSSDSGRNRALQVTPRRGLAAALGAEVYAGDGPTGGGRTGHGRSSSLTQTQAQDLLRNIVSDVMYEFRQETKEDVRGLHLDLLRASRGWKSDLKQYLGDTLDELRQVKEENARLRIEIAQLRRGY